MANKAGRPKAKVSITFSEEELQTLLNSLNFNLCVSVGELHEDMNANSTRHMEVCANELRLFARLRDIRGKKYGAKDAN